jgi:hypothetical protein
MYLKILKPYNAITLLVLKQLEGELIQNKFS